MVGLMQIMIYLLCVYLGFKGVDIFQIALVSSSETISRKIGIAIGVLMICGACVVSAGALYLTESTVAGISDKMNNFPKF